VRKDARDAIGFATAPWAIAQRLLWSIASSRALPIAALTKEKKSGLIFTSRYINNADHN